jgi:hypothetical protein
MGNKINYRIRLVLEERDLSNSSDTMFTTMEIDSQVLASGFKTKSDAYIFFAK